MKNFVFDLYGTLADIRTDETSARFRKKTDALMLRKFGIAHFCKQLQAVAPSASAEDNEPDFFPAFCSIFGNDAAAQAAALYRKRSRAFLRVYRGVRPLLRELARRGAKLYLLSNAQACFTRKELDMLRLTPCFDGIVLSSEFGKKKPSATFFIYLMQRYKLDPAETIYIGNDLTADIEGAKRAGWKTAYIYSDLSPAQDSLSAASGLADFATESFREMANHLLALALQ